MSEKQRQPPKYATVRETADEFRLSPATVYTAIATGKIQAIRIAGSIRIPLTEHARLRGEVLPQN